MYEEVRKSVGKYARFSTEQLNDFTNRLELLQLEKDDLILEKGAICRAWYFVKKGSFRQYYLSKDYEKTTLNLFVENDWMLDHTSFTAQKASENYIEACEQSEVFSLSIHHLHHLIAESPSFFSLGRILETALKDFKSLKDAPPEERYLTLLKDRPELLQKFPLKYIASYLGMTPETLSRVRRKII